MEVIIEISKGSNQKYEYDCENNKLVLDRILHNTNSFPYNYGFIPKTLSPDGDPVDIILLSKHSLIPGSCTKVRVIGKIRTDDEAGQDDKIICVLDNKIDNEYEETLDISELKSYDLNNIIYFLKHYKDGEKNKFVKLGEISGKSDALKFINDHTL